MVVKIFDIIPPHEKHSFHAGKSSNLKGEFHGSVGHKGKPRKKMKFKLYLTLVFFIICVGIIFGGIVFTSSKTKSKVDIWPKVEEITLSKKITLQTGYNEKDPVAWLEKETLPASLFTDQRSASADYPANGVVKKEIKAKGKIKVYNAYSDSSQSLLVGTRFVSENGKLFKSVKQISIPGKTTSGGKSVPGEIDVDVEAAEPGEDYNIGPSTFSIPGFVGTAKYTAFYGKSFEAMTGGYKGDVAKISEADLAKANSELTNKAGQESRQYLIKTIPSEFVFINEDDAVFQEVIEKSNSADSGKEADSFNAGVKVQSTVLIFKKSDVEALAENFIKSSIPTGKVLDIKSLSFEYTIDKKLSLFEPVVEVSTKDKDKKKETTSPAPVTMGVNIAIKFKIYPDMNADQIKKTLLGKSINDVKSILESKEGIDRIKIDAGPVWRRNIPENMDKVEVNLNI